MHGEINRILSAWTALSNLYGLDQKSADFERDLKGKLASQPYCMPFDSAVARYIREQADLQNLNAVRGALFLYQPNLQGKNFHVQNFEQMNGMITARFLEAGPQALSKGRLKENNDSALAELEDRFATIAEHNEQAYAGHKKRFADLEDNAEKLGQSLLESQTKMSEAEATRVKDATKEWVLLRRQFSEDLKLETAVELWNGRAQDHKTAYENARRWTGWTAVVGLVVLVASLVLIFRLAQDQFTEPTPQLIFFAAASALLFTPYVWVLRIMVRSMMAENHLAIDASSRSAMAHTYLALIKENAASKDDRAIILAALFNPVTDGLVKDDAMPTISPTGMVASAITGRNS